MHPVHLRFSACATLFAALGALLLLWPADAHARAKIREAFFTAYPQLNGTVLDIVPSNSGHCGVCHYDFNGAGPKNPWGERVLQAIQSSGCNPNDVACVSTAILAIPDSDHDGDGYWSKADELLNTTTFTNTPTFPGLSGANVGSVVNVNVNEILNHLTPTTGADTQDPVVTVTSPNGGESWAAGVAQTVSWIATDNVAVTTVDVFYRDDESEPWTMIARNLANTGSFQWFVHNTPTTGSRVRVIARDAAANEGEDTSNANFTIQQIPGGIAPTTLRDFKQPGSQPFEAGTLGDHTSCVSCHGGYDSGVEPGHNFLGMMMAQAARDPLFFACLAVAEQDAPSSGDLCLRCHTPIGWLSGRSNPTDGSQLEPVDIDGVSCGFCHRAVDPIYEPGVSPAEDEAVLTMISGHVPTTYANGQYVVDPDARRRGPFGDPVSPHTWLESPFHRSSDWCGTCHDVSNPVFDRIVGADYAPGPLDEPAAAISSLTLFPLERTYSEWKNSEFASGGVFAPEFAGNKADGVVSTCQDCHMRDVLGRGCDDVAAPIRENLPLHDFQGGNAWMPNVIAAMFPGEVDAGALADGAQRAVSMLQLAATVDLDVQSVADSFAAAVTVTNRTGHKLPTGYPEGRRLWLHIVAKDGGGAIVYESGAYDPGTGVLTHDADAVIYEAELGISPALATALGAGAGGKSFHFALNDSMYKDNRIPPLGFTHAAFDAFGGAPVDDSRPAPRYADGQNWDTAMFALPASARSVKATLYYQTTSKEYVEFLRDENTTNTAGQEMYDLWVAHGRSAPVAMAQDSTTFNPVGITLDPGAGALSLRAARNPFRASLELVLTLNRAELVRLDVYDAQGRRVAQRRYGMLSPGTHRLEWDGMDESGRDVGAGIFWANVDAGGRMLGRQVVRLR